MSEGEKARYLETTTDRGNKRLVCFFSTRWLLELGVDDGWRFEVCGLTGRLHIGWTLDSSTKGKRGKDGGWACEQG